MRMWHDRSYLGVSDSEFVSRGYAEDDLFSVNINFEYTEEQRAENAKTAKTMTPEQWSAHCTVAMQRKSAYIFPVMEAIAQNFVCYQYEKGHGPKHESPDWELFFWCGNFSDGLCGRDYSHIRLNFNDRHETSRHKEICNRLLVLMAERFSDLDNLSVAVQHRTHFFDDKINREAAELAKGFGGMKSSYRGMSGRFLCSADGLLFVKKYARSRGYKVSPREILKMSWEMDAA